MNIQKKTIIYGIYTAILLQICFVKGLSQDITNVITGHFDKTAPWKNVVYLLEIKDVNHFFSGDDIMVIDSTIINDDGTFSFNSEKISDTKKFYRLNFIPEGWNPGGFIMDGLQDNYVFLLLDKKSRITLKINSLNIPQSYFVEGDSENHLIKQLIRLTNDRQELMKGIKTQINAVQNQSSGLIDSLTSKLMGIYKKQLDKDKIQITEFIDSVSSPLAKILATKYLGFPENIGDNLLYYQQLDHYLQKKLSDDTYAGQFHELIENYLNVMPLGSIAPDFILQCMNGDTITLSSLKGKIVLLDFWASWCRPCRLENKETVLPLYQTYHEKGLEVLGINMDILQTLVSQA